MAPPKSPCKEVCGGVGLRDSRTPEPRAALSFWASPAQGVACLTRVLLKYFSCPTVRHWSLPPGESPLLGAGAGVLGSGQEALSLTCTALPWLGRAGHLTT